MDLLFAEIISQITLCNGDNTFFSSLLIVCGRFLFYQFNSRGSADRLYAFLQVAHAGFHCVFIDDLAERSVCDLKHIFGNPHCLQRLRDQVLLCDMILFHRGITGK